MKNILILLTLLAGCNLCFSQDGKYQITLEESVIERFKSFVPNMQKVVDSVVTYGFVYDSDNLKVKGYIAEPVNPGKYPVVIFNRGGNRSFGELNDQLAALRLGSIAAWGYVAIASNYRGSSGSEGTDEFGGADVNDILNLIPILSQIEKADTSRMGIYGWSRGGLMTYKILEKTCNFKAAIIGAGITNAFRNISDRPEMEENVYSELIPDYQENREQGLTKRSPIFWPEKLCKETPIFILHGSSDWRVSPEDALDMANKLYELKHPFRLIFFEGGDHGLTEYRKEVDDAVKGFLDHYVKNLNKWPSMEPHGR
jgi:dipeptidyl aminopeptidase/acylaminoacyl peptidase